MKYTVDKSKKNSIEIEMTLTAEEWEQELNEAYNKNKGKFSVEGFRKGKAPRKVIEKVYGPEVFFEDAIGDGFYKNYMTILTKEKDIEPVDAPSLSVKALNDKGIVIVANITVMPEVKLGQYTGLNIKVEPKKVTDKDIKKELDRVKEQQARLVEKAEGEAVANGDIVTLDFAGSIDGKFFDGGTAKDYELEIGSHSFIDTFEDQLVGTKVNEEKDVKVTFPENYQVADLAGKPANFHCTIKAIKYKEYPEINDEFASNVSEFETLNDYKVSIKDKLEEQAAKQAKNETENKIIEQIVKNIEVSIPECMIEDELDYIIKGMENQMMYQGIRMEDYLRYVGTTMDEYRKSQRKEAEKSVKTRLALKEIIKVEKLDLTKEEVDAKIKEMAKDAKKTIKEFKESLSDEHLSYIKNDLLFNKLINFLLEKNA